VSGAPSLREVVRALGGDLWDGGRRANVPAPGHSAGDRSVSLLLDGDRVVAHGFGGTGWREVLADLRARGLVDAAGRLAGAPASRAPGPAARTAAERRAAAARLWAAGGPVADTLSAAHLRRRGVGGPVPAALRHHPAVAAAVYDDRGPRRPALLAAVQDAGGALCAVEVTYLAADGARARARLPRKTVGVVPAGSAVRLAPAGPRLVVAEGVFTALSAGAWFGGPAWALLSTSNLRAWRPPAAVRAVLIAADRGADGEASARRLAAALAARGLAVEAVWPPAPFGDWNEAAVGTGGRRPEGGRGQASRTDGWSGPAARRPDP